MYEWLDQEISNVKTPKFFLTHEESTTDRHDDVFLATMPTAYGEFLSKFGRSKFFRIFTGGYIIGIFEIPQTETIDLETYWYIGWYDERRVLLKDIRQTRPDECPVFEQNKFGKIKRVADTFDEWLRNRWEKAKGQFSAREWKKICEGPDPFSPDELEVIEARKTFHWRVLGIDENCVVRFENY